MTDRLFASCCLGTAYQHALWERCPLGTVDMTEFYDRMAILAALLPASDTDGNPQGGDAKQTPSDILTAGPAGDRPCPTLPEEPAIRAMKGSKT